ncbi:hypothetical protein BELL_0018g00160 [Botrytis elliptica]|uniref:Uncharacterized protein n=1 Tax=Botrytis elliptica TaxID=278938 RepID=A0A4Z1KFI5_9HELO|nr:hypothetical protein BELL_0018g00160 [Botrytis elliptica]
MLMRIGFASLFWTKSPALSDIETLEKLRKVRNVRNVRGKKVGGFETRKIDAQPSVSIRDRAPDIGEHSDDVGRPYRDNEKGGD